MNRTTTIVERIASSEMYKDYERAFSEATQLALALRPVEVWRFALEGKRYENPFCAMLTKCNRTCAACLQTQKKMDDVPGTEARTVTCFAGLCDSAVPLQTGEKLIGFLQTGQVALRKPNATQFGKIAEQLVDCGVTVDLTKLKDAYFDLHFLALQQYASMMKLFETFVKHLSQFANQNADHAEESEVS